VAELSRGAGRALIGVYALFAVAAGARSGVQIGTRFSTAPLAYVLSAVAAVIYLAAAVALARSARMVALACCVVELTGVLAVGTASLLAPTAFPDATVWSDYGSGYLFIPLVLPVLGLIWLRRRARAGGPGSVPVVRLEERPGGGG
jgi:hypothetical protein